MDNPSEDQQPRIYYQKKKMLEELSFKLSKIQYPCENVISRNTQSMLMQNLTNNTELKLLREFSEKKE